MQDFQPDFQPQPVSNSAVRGPETGLAVWQADTGTSVANSKCRPRSAHFQSQESIVHLTLQMYA